ncbi:hypothetical protein GCM10010532_080270 [Dactylosporangium siamense]|uniref:Uncharacterized protein n=1 Tax=Dactylosporangium siamense TaxID=685454 RepID=A0A919UFN5_9ACTN|nr:hypothetical protein Dsi01nite_068790 [Dactylosporangium siamense]
MTWAEVGEPADGPVTVQVVAADAGAAAIVMAVPIMAVTSTARSNKGLRWRINVLRGLAEPADGVGPAHVAAL